jgi:hypothetical protein
MPYALNANVDVAEIVQILMAANTDPIYPFAHEAGFLNAEDTGSESAEGQTTMADHTREEFDAKIAAAEARTDTKFERFEGKLDLVLSKLESVDTKITSAEAYARDENRNIKTYIDNVESRIHDDNRSTRSNLWVIGFSLALLIIALVALYPPFFGLGAQVRDIVDRAIEAAVTGEKK